GRGGGAGSGRATPPRNSAGKVGPPRKLPRETLHARPLNTSSSASVDSDRVGASSKRDLNASWPENTTASTGWPVDWLKAIASPPTTSAAAVVNRNGRVDTTRFVSRASSMIAATATAAAIQRT